MTATVTIHDIKKFAIKSNKELFDGVLDLQAIKFKTSSRMTRTLGRFSVRGSVYYSEQSITLSTLLFGEKKEWKTTLIHELIHAWQYQTDKELGHGYSFKTKAAEIHRKFPEINITRTRGSEFIDKAVADRRSEFGTKQYVIVDKVGRLLFLRNLQGPELSTLRAKGFAIYENKSPINVRHCKNLKALLGARYYYSASVLKEKLDLTKCRKL